MEGNTNGRPIPTINGEGGRLPKTQTPKSERDGRIQKKQSRTSWTIHNIRRGDELHDNRRRLIPEHQEINFR